MFPCQRSITCVKYRNIPILIINKCMDLLSQPILITKQEKNEVHPVHTTISHVNTELMINKNMQGLNLIQPHRLSVIFPLIPSAVSSFLISLGMSYLFSKQCATELVIWLFTSNNSRVPRFPALTVGRKGRNQQTLIPYSLNNLASLHPLFSSSLLFLQGKFLPSQSQQSLGNLRSLCGAPPTLH